MHPLAARLAALGLGSLLAATTLVVAAGLTGYGRIGLSFQSYRSWKTSLGLVRVELAAEACDVAVRAEIGSLRDHPWAGDYLTPSGFSNLVLAPRAGYTVFRNYTCGVGTGFHTYGRIVEATAESLALSDSGPGWGRLLSEQRLYVVRWGDYVFLVPEDHEQSFRAALAEQRELPEEWMRYVGDDARLARLARLGFARCFESEQIPLPTVPPELPAAWR